MPARWRWRSPRAHRLNPLPRPRPAAPAPGAAAAKPKAPEPKGEPGGRGAPGPAGIDRNSPVTIDADLLENLQKEGLVVFTGNVVANQNNSDPVLGPDGGLPRRQGRRHRAHGVERQREDHHQDCKIGTAKRAEYYDAEQRVVLVGNARVWQEDNVVTGERITIFLAEDRSVVEGGKQERVKAVFYPRGQEQPAATASRRAGAVRVRRGATWKA